MEYSKDNIRQSKDVDAEWRRIFLEKMQERGLNLQEKTLENIKHHREQVAKLKKTAPPDELTKEWFSEDKLSVDTRAYLLEKLMPTIVPGLEAVLKEVEKKKVLEDGSVKFDPVNFLGEYLMRNKPEFSVGSHAHPYVRGLREVVANLKDQVFDLEFNRLGQLKEELNESQNQRAQVQNIRSQIKQRREGALSLQFQEWTLDVTGRIPLALVQSALKSFLEVILQLQQEAIPAYDIDLEIVHTMEQKLNKEEFVEYVYPFISKFSTDVFQEFLHHLAQCADMFRETIRHDIRRQKFSDLFFKCDPGKVGFLDRQRILALMESFFDNTSPESPEWQPRNPRQWPVIELSEMDPEDFWANFQETEQLTEGKDHEESRIPFSESTPSPEPAVVKDVETVSAENPGEAASQLVEGIAHEEHNSEKEPHSEEHNIDKEPHSEEHNIDKEPHREEHNIDKEPHREEHNIDKEPHREEYNIDKDPHREEYNIDKDPHHEEHNIDKDPHHEEHNIDKDPHHEEHNIDKDPHHEEHNIDKDPHHEEHNIDKDPHHEEHNIDRDPHFVEGQACSDTESQLVEGRPSEETHCDKDPHIIEGQPWSGELLTADLPFRYSSYGDRSQDECSVTASQFTDLHPIITDINSRRPSNIASAFSSSQLNLPQFVQLMETFLGVGAPLPIVDKLTNFIQKEYVETEEEKMTLLNKVRYDALIAHQKLVLQALFEKWDNDGSGFLELLEVEAVLSKYKDGMESELIDKGRESLSSSQSQRGVWKLSASEFCRYIQDVVSMLPGLESEVFESVVEFLTTSVERTQVEKMRGTSRRKWLQHIHTVAETSGGSLDPVYKAIFQALYKDAEAHGNNKKISASIALLEQSVVEGKWKEVLRYVACTSDDAFYVLNKILHRDMENVSFAAVDSGTPVHVPRVQYHGSVHFWNTDRPEEERKGSLIVLPLIDAQQQVFGTLSIDTLRDTRERNIFLTHEISFYQGITNMFSTAYHHIEMKTDILQLASSAFAWIYSRAPNIHIINTYLMEPSIEKSQGYVFRNMMHTDNSTGVSEIFSSPAILRRRDNLFRDYLFKCADSSEVITTDAYGERHIAVPIRDLAGRAVGVLDISTRQCCELPAHEYQDLQKMLQMLQEACYEILEQKNTDSQGEPLLEAEQVPGQKRVGVLFHRFMLKDLRQCVSKLDYRSFAELKSYKEPPSMVHSILKAVLLLFSPDWAESEEIHSWNQCKLKVNTDLIRKILSFDPTAQSVQINPEILAKYIKGIPRGAVWKHGSIPAEHLYNWTFTCMCLLELTQKMQNTHPPSLDNLPGPQ
ncbi:EF-hand calcium-binding domain-containing protein 5 [Pelobates fuscus]|uniref:EF-hand calcium-binding domain-containing protein 5 n=1 Tax=Pelobates fuscus TaxID=191477 RepID=UPI002FE4FA25